MNGGAYILDGRTFKTVRGLCSYVVKKHGATEVSGIGGERKMRVYLDRDTVCAVYQCSPPKLGEDMTLTLLA